MRLKSEFREVWSHSQDIAKYCIYTVIDIAIAPCQRDNFISNDLIFSRSWLAFSFIRLAQHQSYHTSNISRRHAHPKLGVS